MTHPAANREERANATPKDRTRAGTVIFQIWPTLLFSQLGYTPLAFRNQPPSKTRNQPPYPTYLHGFYPVLEPPQKQPRLWSHSFLDSKSAGLTSIAYDGVVVIAFVVVDESICLYVYRIYIGFG